MSTDYVKESMVQHLAGERSPITIRPRYLNPKQAAMYLGISVFSIYRLVERRAIPFVPLYPSASATKPKKRPSIRFDIESLDSWMRKQTVKPAAEYVDERTTNE